MTKRVNSSGYVSTFSGDSGKLTLVGDVGTVEACNAVLAENGVQYKYRPPLKPQFSVLFPTADPVEDAAILDVLPDGAKRFLSLILR